MKKLIAILVSATMIFALCATVFAAPAEVTWEDYQQYLIDTAGSNAPDLQEFIDQVEAIGSWDELDQTVSPWDQMFTTIGLSTWDEFAAGEVKEALVPAGENMGGGDSAEGESEEGESPEGESPEGESPEGESPADEAADMASQAEENIADMTASEYQTNNSDTSRAQDLGHVFVGISIVDGEYDEANSNWAYDGGDIVLENSVYGEGFTAVRAYGDTTVNISGALKLTDSSDGQYASDFTGVGAAITAADGATVYIDGVNYYSEGFGRSFAIIQNSTAVITNSEIATAGANPLTDSWDGYYNSANTSMMLSPPWVLGIQGGIRAINVLGSGSTLVVADSSITAGGWACVSTDGCSNPYLYLFNTELKIQGSEEIGLNSGWKVLGYDEDAYGTGYGTYNIGNATENFYGVNISGQTYAVIETSGGPSNYMGLVAGETYEAYSEDGTLIGAYTATEDVPTVINTVFGFMNHGNAEINVLEGTIVNTEAATILYKNGVATWTIDGAEINPKSGIILQMMDNDDSTVGGFNPFGTYLNEEAGFPTEGYTDAVSYVFTTDTKVDPSKTYYIADLDAEGGYVVVDEPEDAGTVAYYERSLGGSVQTLNLANGEYTGDIYNATGYYEQAPDSLVVNIADSAVLNGDIALTSYIHGIFLNDRSVDDVIAAIDEANANHANIGGYYEGLEDIEYVFIDAEGAVTDDKDAAIAIQFTKFSTAEYYLLGQILNMVNYNGMSAIDVTVEGTWNVANYSLITYLNVAEGAEVYGEIIDLEDGSFLLVPSDEALPAGEYGKAFVNVEAPAAASGGGESAEGESAEGESAEGESAEGESAEGESAEGESPAEEAPAEEAPAAEGEDTYAAYVDYIHEWLLAEDAINDTMEADVIENEFMPLVEAGDFESFPADMLFNGMLESGTALTYDEWLAQQ